MCLVHFPIVGISVSPMVEIRPTAINPARIGPCLHVHAEHMHLPMVQGDEALLAIPTLVLELGRVSMLFSHVVRQCYFRPEGLAADVTGSLTHRLLVTRILCLFLGVDLIVVLPQGQTTNESFLTLLAGDFQMDHAFVLDQFFGVGAQLAAAVADGLAVGEDAVVPGHVSLVTAVGAVVTELLAAPCNLDRSVDLLAVDGDLLHDGVLALDALQAAGEALA